MERLAVWMVMVVACMLSPRAYAMEEARLPTEYFTQVFPYYQEGGRRGLLKGMGDLDLDYVAFERSDEIGALVVLPGRAGAHLYLAEFFHDLRYDGWSIYSLDHRGQGFSQRMLDNPQKGHVEEFDDYVEDLRRFMDDVVNKRPHRVVVLLGASMGATIATAYAERFLHKVDGLVVVAPYFKGNYGIFSENTALAAAGALMAVGQSPDYAPGQKDAPDNPTFEDADWTHSRARFDIVQELNRRYPQVKLGGATVGWTWTSLHATKRVRTEAFRLTMPILMLQAGQDTVVMADAQDAVCERARSCRKVRLPNSHHSVLAEADESRNQAIHEIRSFMTTVDPQGGCSSARVEWLAAPMMGLLVLRRRRPR